MDRNRTKDRNSPGSQSRELNEAELDGIVGAFAGSMSQGSSILRDQKGASTSS
jgi:hypothetical protein